jgi:dolichol-phosphate mannosyltransferase
MTPGPSADNPAQSDPGSPADHIVLSVVAPAHNEEGNIPDLVKQVGEACQTIGVPFEFLIVDDGSTDATRDRIIDAMHANPWLRCVAMTNTPPGSGNGQSAAFHAGFRAARGDLIAVLDADLQNDPADYPRLYQAMLDENADFVQGDRSAARRQGDAWIRQVGSIVGRKFRLWLLGDRITDTGCSLRIMKREIALQLPLEFKGAHRFIPAMANQLGYKVIERPVSHRHRAHGETKYGMGIMKRAIPGLIDCFAIRWMRSRRRPTTSELITTADAKSARSDAAEIKSPALPSENADKVST